MKKSFFAEGNVKSINIDGENVTIVMNFDGCTPMAIVEALSELYSLDSNITKKEEPAGIEIKPDGSANENSENLVAESQGVNNSETQDFEGTSEVEEKGDIPQINPQTKKRRGGRMKAPDSLESEELEAIAKRSSSFEEFVDNVAYWLKLGTREKTLKIIVEAIPNGGKANWNWITNEVKRKIPSFGQYDKTIISNKVNEKFKGSKNPLQLLPFLKAVALYKKYDFGVTRAKPRANDFSDVDIPEHFNCLKELCATIDKDALISQRVEKTLYSMRVNMYPKEQHRSIFDFVTGCICMKEIDYSKSATYDSCSEEEAQFLRMAIVKMFSDYYYDANEQTILQKTVTCMEILQVLQKLLVKESELH